MHKIYSNRLEEWDANEKWTEEWDYVIKLRDEIMMLDKFIRRRLRNDSSASTFRYA